MKKLSYKYVKYQIEKEGYKLLSTEYKNIHEKLKVECPKKHQYEVRFYSFQQGSKCPICYNNIRGDNKKSTYKYVKTQIEKTGYKLLSKEYKNARSFLKIECPREHQYETKYNNFQQGRKCPVCNGKQKNTYEYVKTQIEKEGCKLLSNKYNSNKEKLKILCPKGHQYKVRYNDFQQGYRCPVCWDMKHHSISEKNCLEIIKQLIPNEKIIENDRTQIVNPKTGRFLELDIYIPELNKAIEFNGEYWHDSAYSKYKDNQKQIQCQEKNIDLLVINYQNWINNKEKEKDHLKGFIGGFPIAE